MKKLLCLFLCATAVLGLFSACGAQEEPPVTVAPVVAFSVGYASADISPTQSVPLDGYGDAQTRLSTSVADPISLICLALSDPEGNTVLLITADLYQAYDSLVSGLQTHISQLTGVAADHILFHVTHSHNAPAVSMTGTPAIDSYLQQLKDTAAQVAADALADRSDAQMYTGFCRPTGYNSVRHYLIADGTYQANNIQKLSPGSLIGHTKSADNLMQLVKFTREGAKDILLVNWQAHPMDMEESLYTAVSANVAGALRRELETALDCLPILITGGSGNLESGSRIPGEGKATDYAQLGGLLAQESAATAESLESAAVEKIQFRTQPMTLTDNSGNSVTASLYTLSLGQLALVCAPFEIFDTNAAALRDNSPFQMTLLATCTNGDKGYLPTPEAFALGSYEAEKSSFPQGTAELVQAELAGMLDTCFQTSRQDAQEKADGYITPVFTPATDGVTYINPTPGVLTQVKTVKNGYYSIKLTANGTAKNMLVNSKALAVELIGMPAMQLVFDESGVIIDIAK